MESINTPCISSSTKIAGPAEDRSANLQSRVCCPNCVVKEMATKLATMQGQRRERPRKKPARHFFCVTSVYYKRRTTMRLLARVPTLVKKRPLHNLPRA